MMSIFTDKTSIILRKMLKYRNSQWVIQDFIKAKDKEFGIGQGRIQKTLNEMERLGYIERDKRGAKSRAVLTNSKMLLKDWVGAYRFEYNEIHSYYSEDKNIIKKIRDFFKKHEYKYAFTLHTGANLQTSFVKSGDVYLYLKSDNFKKDILDLRQKLDLKELVRGGNIHIAKPYYKHSAFFNAQAIKGFRVVSNLQLYLDLYNFQPRGREHAEHLKKLLEDKGKHLE